MTEMAAEDFRNVVVVAVDGSEHSDFTLKWYVEHIHEPRNKVHVAHSLEFKTVHGPAVGKLSGDSFMHAVSQKVEEEKEKSKALTQKLKEDLKNLELTADIEELHGDAGHAIIHFAREKNASFIVIGSRGKGKIRRTVTGSVTDYVVHHSGIPVIVCRHKAFHEHEQEHQHPHLKKTHLQKHKDGDGEPKGGHDKDDETAGQRTGGHHESEEHKHGQDTDKKKGGHAKEEKHKTGHKIEHKSSPPKEGAHKAEDKKAGLEKGSHDEGGDQKTRQGADKKMRGHDKDEKHQTGHKTEHGKEVKKE